MAIAKDEMVVDFSAGGLFFRQTRDEPLTTEQLDTNFIFIEKLITVLLDTEIIEFLGGDKNGDSKLQFGEFDYGVNFPLIAQKTFDKFSGDSELASLIFGRTYIPVLSPAHLQNNYLDFEVRNGTVAFDSDTKKTLTYYDGGWYDAAGNAVYTYSPGEV